MPFTKKIACCSVITSMHGKKMILCILHTVMNFTFGFFKRLTIKMTEFGQQTFNKSKIMSDADLPYHILNALGYFFVSARK